MPQVSDAEGAKGRKSLVKTSREDRLGPGAVLKLVFDSFG